MNKQIRSVGVVGILLFCALFAQLTRLQVIDSKKLTNDPRNGRVIAKNFNAHRGFIQTADAVVVAKSVDVNSKDYGGRFQRMRQYPEGDMYSQLVGFYSFTYGSSGLEQQYDSDLRGKPNTLKNSIKQLTQTDTSENMTLTINSSIQKVARDQLGNKKGAVVALNPKDGSILAMWSYPSYDPNPLADLDQTKVRNAWTAYNADPNKPMASRAYHETYPPGSTFKTVTSAAVLESQPALLTKTYPTLRSLPLPGTTQSLSNFGNESCGGQLPELLKVSCNTGFAAIGLDLGAQKLFNEAVKFGFDVASANQPLDLPAVASSIFPDPTSFIHNLPALAKSAIGQQDVRATPLQMALIAAGIANDGVIMKPHLMKEFRDASDNVVSSFKPSPWLTAMTADNAHSLRDFMIGVVKGGTGTRAQIPGMDVAGKTGTAQNGTTKPHAWFIGFAPAQNPTVAVAVLVESQDGISDSATGGAISAPIAKAVMQEALKQQSLQQQALAQKPTPTP